jgi:Zn-dependent protease
MHEFGHALACRQVGGKADQIVLWPLGGVAYVAPPPRPGANLWSIAAGPLVNVVLVPVFFGLLFVSQRVWVGQMPDVHAFLRAVALINLVILFFNLLPIYPLDGGQILRSLLWYPFGKARSLTAATVVGFVGGAALAGLAVWMRSIWIGVMTLFLLSNCWRSFQQARAMREVERLPRRRELGCPACGVSPPIGIFWRCEHCAQPFDLFASATVCPQCTAVQTGASCVDCGSTHAHSTWGRPDRVMV